MMQQRCLLSFDILPRLHFSRGDIFDAIEADILYTGTRVPPPADATIHTDRYMMADGCHAF
jgi:hypothetical protein